MTDPETSTPLELAPPARRIAFFGAGPLAEGGSAFAPGVANRLWNFMEPALAAGHDCLLFSIEPDAPTLAVLGPLPKPEPCQGGGKSWRCYRINAMDCLAPERLIRLVERFDPHLLAGAGTLLAARAACAAAGGQPVWADLFGDPLAEIQAKAAVLGEHFQMEEKLQVWSLLVEVLTRADAFSSVSRRQADALLGQLALAGRLSGELAGRSGPGEMMGEAALIHAIPCSLETLEIFAESGPGDRAGWLARSGLPPDALVALWSGGFNAWADPQTLVRGIELAMDEEPRLHLVATGGELPGYLGKVFEDFKGLVQGSRHGARMHALGWLGLTEANQWLRLADVGLLADRPCAETRLGARNRLLYHAAAACPVVASRGSEVVADMDAAGGLLAFPPEHAEAMAHTVLRILGDPALARAVGERGYSFCEMNYLFAESARPFLNFAARPRHTSPADPEAERERSAGAWIAHYLDLKVRQGEWAELNRYRSGGRLAGLRDFLARFKPGGKPPEA